MRVALVCPYAWDAPGGVQVHVRQLAAYLRDTGHEVRVFTPAFRPLAEDGVTIVGRAIPIPYQGTVAPISPTPGSFAGVGAALRAFRPDVVHVHEPLSPSASMFAVLRSKAPVVGTFHAYAERSALLDIAAPVLRPVWRKLAARIAVSETAARFVRARFPGDVTVIPNGLDITPFRDAALAAMPLGRRVVWVGRLDRQKGFPVAVRAFQDLAAKLPDVLLVVAGDGRDRDAVDRLDPSTRSRVHMLGTVPHAELPGVLVAGDVFLAPALGQETFGYVLIEAMASGVPVVASRIPGYDEVVRDDIDGILVPPGDAEALSAAVQRVLCEPALAERLRDAGRDRAAEYAWDRIGPRVVAVYERVAGGSG